MPKPKRNRALNVIDGKIAQLKNDLAVAKAQVESLQVTLANQESTRAAIEKAYQRQPVVKTRAAKNAEPVVVAT